MSTSTHEQRCPVSGAVGRSVPLITLKALLRPHALATIDSAAQYRYCPSPDCDTVYFAEGQTFGRADVEVPTYAKDPGGDVPVCYCFGWTRDRLRADLAGRGVAPDEIRAHIRAGRCGCDVNNPKGSCCLGDVELFLAGERRAAPR